MLEGGRYFEKILLIFSESTVSYQVDKKSLSSVHYRLDKKNYSIGVSKL